MIVHFLLHVAYVPGKYFFIDEKEGINTLRLSFTTVGEEKIKEGIKILGEVFRG